LYSVLTRTSPCLLPGPGCLGLVRNTKSKNRKWKQILIFVILRVQILVAAVCAEILRFRNSKFGITYTQYTVGTF
jgi:hypothetical protein